MEHTAAPEPLAHYLRTYCNVDAVDIEALREQILRPKLPDRAAAFREQLARTIVHGTLMPQDYEALTREDFDSPSDLNKWLRKLWACIFGDEPIPGDEHQEIGVGVA